MKNLLMLFIALSTGLTLQAQTNLYENPQFDEIAKDHKSIAVVPFKTQVKLRPKQMKDMSGEQLQRIEKAEGEGIQSAMYSWFLKRKKRGDLQNIEVQDPKVTTALLRRNDISYDNITDYTPQELAQILGVDALISGEFETNKPMSEGASIVLGALFGFFGSTNTALMNMSVHNGTDGVLLWNYNKQVRGSIGSNTEDLVNILMRKASRRLSYTKKSKDR